MNNIAELPCSTPCSPSLHPTLTLPFTLPSFHSSFPPLDLYFLIKFIVSSLSYVPAFLPQPLSLPPYLSLSSLTPYIFPSPCLSHGSFSHLLCPSFSFYLFHFSISCFFTFSSPTPLLLLSLHLPCPSSLLPSPLNIFLLPALLFYFSISHS